jgi:hypothetical protein
MWIVSGIFQTGIMRVRSPNPAEVAGTRRRQSSSARALCCSSLESIRGASSLCSCKPKGPGPFRRPARSQSSQERRRGRHGEQARTYRMGRALHRQRAQTCRRKAARKRRLRLGSAGALSLSRTATNNKVYPPKSAQEQQGRKNSHNGVSAAWYREWSRKSNRPT